MPDSQSSDFFPTFNSEPIVSVNLEDILAQALQALAQSNDLNQLDQVRVDYLGKKGVFTQQMKELGSLDPEQRRSVGQVINHAKEQFQQQLEARKAAAGKCRTGSASSQRAC